MGSLTSAGASELEFRYSSDWLSFEEAFPVSLSIPLAERAYRTNELLPFLDNLLPDQQDVRRTIAARVGARGTDPFSLLWELGRDCVGALQFLPEDEEPDWSGRPHGHAKNFSLALGPQGRFRLTPLYDVLSLQFNVDAQQVSRRDFRVAMAVGENRHYEVGEIQPRQFLQTATAAGVDGDSAQAWMLEVAQAVPAAIERVAQGVNGVVRPDLLDAIAAGALLRARLVT